MSAAVAAAAFIGLDFDGGDAERCASFRSEQSSDAAGPLATERSTRGESPGAPEGALARSCDDATACNGSGSRATPAPGSGSIPGSTPTSGAVGERFHRRWQRRLSLDETFQDDSTFAFGWVDAPPGCVDGCGLLLWCCGRHPAQKVSFVARARATEEAAAAATAAATAARVAAPVSPAPQRHQMELAFDVSGPVDAFALAIWRFWDAAAGTAPLRQSLSGGNGDLGGDERAQSEDNSECRAAADCSVSLSDGGGGGVTTAASNVPELVPVVESPGAGSTMRDRLRGVCARIRRLDTYGDSGNPARRVGCCGWYPCTIQTLIAYSAATVYAGYCVFYLVLFGLYQVCVVTIRVRYCNDPPPIPPHSRLTRLGLSQLRGRGRRPSQFWRCRFVA